jgi:ADP-ribosylglycohydrolase
MLPKSANNAPDDKRMTTHGGLFGHGPPTVAEVTHRETHPTAIFGAFQKAQEKMQEARGGNQQEAQGENQVNQEAQGVNQEAQGKNQEAQGENQVHPQEAQELHNTILRSGDKIPEALP